MTHWLRATLIAVTLATPALADFDRGLAAFERGDFATALAEWTPLARDGMVEAQFNVGLLYHGGHGVEVDQAEAHRWFLAAAEQGYARAQYRVAELYESGDGVERNLVQAHLWFAQAGSQKYLDAKKRKKQVAKRMNPYEIAEAEMLHRYRKRDAKLARED